MQHHFYKRFLISDKRDKFECYLAGLKIQYGNFKTG